MFMLHNYHVVKIVVYFTLHNFLIIYYYTVIIL